MKRQVNTILVLLTCVLIAFGAAACNKNKGGVSEPALTLSATSATIATGGTYQITITQKPDGNVTYKSDNEAVATVSDGGLVTGVSEGSTRIVVAAGSKSADFTVTVIDGEQQPDDQEEDKSFVFQNPALTISEKDTRKLDVLLDGILVPSGVTYASNNEEVLTVEASTGLATAVSSGTAIVTATYNGLTAQCTVTVKRVITLSTASTVEYIKDVGESAEIMIEAKDVNGAPVSAPDLVVDTESTDVVNLTVAGNKITATAKAGGVATVTVDDPDSGAHTEFVVSVAYKVTRYDNLAEKMPLVNAYIVLDSDITIDPATVTWHGAGNKDNPTYVIEKLAARLDGNGHKIIGLTTINKKENSNYGNHASFIKTIEAGAVVENLIYESEMGDPTGTNADARLYRYNAVFARENKGTIKDSYIKGTLYLKISAVNSGSFYETFNGIVLINSGTMERLITELNIVRDGHTAAEDPQKFGFAVKNTGMITNCVTVSFASNTSGQHDFMSSSKLAIEDGKTTANDATDVIVTPGAAESAQAYLGNKAQIDENRSNCYIFTSYGDLLNNGTGYGDKFNDTVFAPSAYSDIAAATAQSALGSAWTFDVDNGAVKLNGIEVANNVIEVSSFEQLVAAAPIANSIIRLSGDITIAPATVTWHGVGNKDNPTCVIEKLAARLDGNGHKISGLTTENKKSGNNGNNVSFIKTIETGAVVENLIYEGALGYNSDNMDESVKANVAVHRWNGLFAYENKGTIRNSFIKGAIYTNQSGQNSTLNSVVVRNIGTMEHLITDFTLYENSSKDNRATTPRKYGFAIYNTGNINDCVTVSTATNSDGQYDFMSCSDLEADKIGSTSNFTSDDTNYSNHKLQLDEHRSDCYIFASYDNLLTGTGYGEKKTEGAVDLDNYDNTVTAATAQNVLGTAWKFEGDTIRLGDSVVYQNVS